MLTFVYGFALFAESFVAAMELKEVTFSLLGNRGMHIHPTKGHHTTTKVGEPLGMTLAFGKGVFHTPKTKDDNILALAKQG